MVDDRRFERTTIEFLALPSAPPELRLQGHLKFDEAARLWESTRKRVALVEKGETIHFDLSRVESVDGGTMALLVHLRNELKFRGVRSEFIGATGRVKELVHLYHGDEAPVRRVRIRVCRTARARQAHRSSCSRFATLSARAVSASSGRRASGGRTAGASFLSTSPASDAAAGPGVPSARPSVTSTRATASSGVVAASTPERREKCCRRRCYDERQAI